MLASFYLTFRNRLDLFEVLNQGVISVLIPVIIVLSFLMVSTIPFDKIPPFDRVPVRKHKGRLILFRSEEHASELQSRGHIVFRLLLDNKGGEQKLWDAT